MRFTKVHGLGNDFVLIDAMRAPGRDYGKIAPVLCGRQTGVGADGLIVAEPSGCADIRMRIINADGGEAEMCGNGVRAFAKYAYERGLVRSPVFAVETLAGIVKPALVFDGARVAAVRVDMGRPLFDSADIPVRGEGLCLNRTLSAAGREFVFSSARVGVPHTAVRVEDPLTFDLYTYGPAIERHPFFPQRTNVDFFRVIDRGSIEMRTWERGAGPTLACGTGSCATAVLCAKTGLTGRTVDVRLALGTLSIEWAADDTVYMTGPAELVFDGEFPDERLP